MRLLYEFTGFPLLATRVLVASCSPEATSSTKRSLSLLSPNPFPDPPCQAASGVYRSLFKMFKVTRITNRNVHGLGARLIHRHLGSKRTVADDISVGYCFSNSFTCICGLLERVRTVLPFPVLPTNLIRAINQTK